MLFRSIASMMESMGIDRKLNPFGTAKGWKKSRLQTANGFNVVAFGLDVAARGTKIDNYRPDLIIFDDIDNEHDTPMAIQKKIDRITKSIIPAGSSDAAILFIQNLIHEDGVVGQLYTGKADFCQNRKVFMEPAVIGMKYEVGIDHKLGINKYMITGGTASWEGQSLETCQKQMDEWGLRAFLTEAQHEVLSNAGTFFDVSKLSVINM